MKGLPSVKVNYFSFLANIKKIVSMPKLMNNSVWRSNYVSIDVSELNTGSWWKGADLHLEQHLACHNVRVIAILGRTRYRNPFAVMINLIKVKQNIVHICPFWIFFHTALFCFSAGKA